MPLFQIAGLDPAPFQPLFELDDAALAVVGARRLMADRQPGYPCRISLEDIVPGERVILLGYRHQDEDTPFRASGPIYIRPSAQQRVLAPGEITDYLRTRLLSVRAYDASHIMVAAEVCEGHEAAAAFESLLVDPDIAYLHVHTARRGCFLCRVDRISQ